MQAMPTFAPRPTTIPRQTYHVTCCHVTPQKEGLHCSSVGSHATHWRTTQHALCHNGLWVCHVACRFHCHADGRDIRLWLSRTIISRIVAVNCLDLCSVAFAFENCNAFHTFKIPHFARRQYVNCLAQAYSLTLCVNNLVFYANVTYYPISAGKSNQLEYFVKSRSNWQKIALLQVKVNSKKSLQSNVKSTALFSYFLTKK